METPENPDKMEIDELKSTQRGTVTLEAAIVFPAVFITIIAILWLSIVYTQNMMGYAAAMRAAHRAASNWQIAADSRVFDPGVSGKDLISKESFAEHDPYRDLFDGVNGTNAKRLENAQNYADKLFGYIPNMVEESEHSPSVKKTGMIFKKVVEVTAEKEYINPASGLFHSYGYETDMNTTIVVRSPINTPGEFVRNASLIYDLLVSKTLLD